MTIFHQGKSVAVGNYASEEEAARAYNAYVLKNGYDLLLNDLTELAQDARFTTPAPHSVDLLSK